MPKDFSLQNLLRDLEYIVFGTDVHLFLFDIFAPKERASVLEIGCGSGKFSLSYALKGCFVSAIDIDPTCVEYAQRLLLALSALTRKYIPAEIKIGDMHHLAFPDNSFDFVFSEGTHQHWPDEERRQGSINEAVRVLRPGGIFCAIGNNGLNPKEEEIDRTFQFRYMGMPPTRKCFSPDELRERMEMMRRDCMQPAPPPPTQQKPPLVNGMSAPQTQPTGVKRP